MDKAKAKGSRSNMSNLVTLCDGSSTMSGSNSKKKPVLPTYLQQILSNSKNNIFSLGNKSMVEVMAHIGGVLGSASKQMAEGLAALTQKEAELLRDMMALVIHCGGSIMRKESSDDNFWNWMALIREGVAPQDYHVDKMDQIFQKDIFRKFFQNRTGVITATVWAKMLDEAIMRSAAENMEMPGVLRKWKTSDVEWLEGRIVNHLKNKTVRPYKLIGICAEIVSSTAKQDINKTDVLKSTKPEDIFQFVAHRHSKYLRVIGSTVMYNGSFPYVETFEVENIPLPPSPCGARDVAKSAQEGKVTNASASVVKEKSTTAAKEKKRRWDSTETRIEVMKSAAETKGACHGVRVDEGISTPVVPLLAVTEYHHGDTGLQNPPCQNPQTQTSLVSMSKGAIHINEGQSMSENAPSGVTEYYHGNVGLQNVPCQTPQTFPVSTNEGAIPMNESVTPGAPPGVVEYYHGDMVLQNLPCQTHQTQTLQVSTSEGVNTLLYQSYSHPQSGLLNSAVCPPVSPNFGPLSSMPVLFPTPSLLQPYQGLPSISQQCPEPVVTEMEQENPPISAPQLVSPSLIPDATLEAAVTSLLASLGCENELLTASFIESRLLELMQISALSDIGIQDIHDFQAVRELERKQNKVNEVFLSNFAASPLLTLHDLHSGVLEVFDVMDFRQLGLGPFSKQPMLLRYFKVVPSPCHMVKIKAVDVYVHLLEFLAGMNKQIATAPVNPLETFMAYLKQGYSVECEDQLGIHVRDFTTIQETLKQILRRQMSQRLQWNCGNRLKRVIKKRISVAIRNLEVALFSTTFAQSKRSNYGLLLLEDRALWNTDAADMIEKVFKHVENICAALENGGDILGESAIENGPYTSHVLREFFVHLEEEPYLRELLKLCICVGTTNESKSSEPLSNCSRCNLMKLLHPDTPQTPILDKPMSAAGCVPSNPESLFHESRETILDIILQCGLQESQEEMVETVEAVLLSHFFSQGVRSVEQLGEGDVKNLIKSAGEMEEPSKQQIWYESAICSDSRVVTYKSNVSNLGLGLLGSQELEDAMNCLLSCPILEDLAEWSSWDLVFEPEFGSLRGFIKDNMISADISALEIKPGTLLRIPVVATVAAFTEAVEKKDVSKSCGQLVSLVVSDKKGKEMLIEKLPVTMVQLMKEMKEAEEADETDMMLDAMLEGAKLHVEGPTRPRDKDSGIVKFVHRCLMKLPLLIGELVAEKLFLSPLAATLGVSDEKVRHLMTDRCHTITERNKLCQLGLVLQFEEWYKSFMQRMEKLEFASNGALIIENDLHSDGKKIDIVKEQETENLGGQSLESRIDDILKGKDSTIKLPDASNIDLNLGELMEEPEKQDQEEGELVDSSATEMSDAEDVGGKDGDKTIVAMEQESVVNESAGSGAAPVSGRVRTKSKSSDHGFSDSMDPSKAEALFSEDRWEGESKHTLIMALVAIKKHWSESNSYSLKELKLNVQVLTNNGFLCPVKSTVHFGPAYGCLIDFQKQFPGVEWNILDPCYIDDFHPNSSTRCWKEFFRELGVWDGLAIQRKNMELSRDELEIGALSCYLPEVLSYESAKGSKFDYFCMNDVICNDLVSLQVDFVENEVEHMKTLYQILSKDLNILQQYMTTMLCNCDIEGNTDEIQEMGIMVDTTFWRYLKKMEWVPVQRTSFERFLNGGALVGKETNYCKGIKDVYIRIPEIERVLAHTVSYLDNDLDPDLAVLLGAKSTLVCQDVLEHFIKWSCNDEDEQANVTFMTSLQHMKKVYQYLKDHLPEEKLSAFCELPFVFIPDELGDNDHWKVTGKFYRIDQVCLHDPLYIISKYTAIQGCPNWLVPIEPHYDEFWPFFSDVAMVESVPRLKDYLIVIETMIGNNEDIKADIYVIFSIIGEQLSQLQDEEFEMVQTMLRKFLDGKKMFPTLHDIIVSINEEPYVCFVKDVSESLIKVITAMNDVHVIKVDDLTETDPDPCISIDNVKKFMLACGIHDISDAIEIKLDIPEGKKFPRFNAEKHWSLAWKGRMCYYYLKKKHPVFAKKIAENKVLDKFQKCKYFMVDKFHLVYTLKGRPSYRHAEECVLYVKGDLLKVYGEVKHPNFYNEVDNFLINYMAMGDEKMVQVIRLFLCDILPVMDQLDVKRFRDTKGGTEPHLEVMEGTDLPPKKKRKGDDRPTVGQSLLELPPMYKQCTRYFTSSYQNVVGNAVGGSMLQAGVGPNSAGSGNVVPGLMDYSKSTHMSGIIPLQKGHGRTHHSSLLNQPVINSDVIKLVKSQLSSKSNNNDNATSSKSVPPAFVTGPTLAQESASAAMVCTPNQESAQGPPDETFLQAQQNIHMMIQGQHPMFSGKSS